MSRTIELVQFGNVMSITAAELGFPYGKYPTHINLRDEQQQRHHFDLDEVETLEGVKTAVYVSGEMRILVALLWEVT